MLSAYEYGSLRQEPYLRPFFLPITRNMHEAIRDWAIILRSIPLDHGAFPNPFQIRLKSIGDLRT